MELIILQSTPSCQQLCIFCAHRLRGDLVPIRRALKATQRSIHSSTRSLRPSAVAALKQGEERDVSFPRNPPNKPLGGGGWAASSSNAELTPEEEHQKKRIRERAAASSSSTQLDQSTPDLPFRTQRVLARPAPDRVIRRHTLEEKSTPDLLFRKHIMAPKPQPERIGLDRTPQSIRQSTSRNSQGSASINRRSTRRVDFNASNTTSLTDSGQYDPSVSQDWQHLRRSAFKAPRAAAANSVSQQQPRSPATGEDYGAFERGRREREEQAKVGNFVGFDNAKSEMGLAASAAQSRVVNGQASVQKPSLGDSLGGKTWRPVFGAQETSQSTFTGEADHPSDSIVSQHRSVGVVQDQEYPEVRSPTRTYDLKAHVEPSAQDTTDKDDITRHRRRRSERVADEPSRSSNRITHFEEPSRGKERYRQRRRKQFESEYDEEIDEAAIRAERKKQRKKDKVVQKAAAPPIPILLPEFISVTNLAKALRTKTEQFADKLKSLGFDDMSYDHVLNAETAGLIAMEYNFEPIVDKSATEDLHSRPPPVDKSLLPQRPPVVTIMGHVDHGKTTLLDWLRKSSVAASEHGGITQHIGAFSVPMPSGKIITFLDTPGHAAFLSMRKRGANVTDIVILVVAADDSVKPQTIEAIKHAKAAKVPMIVAINKIDKGDADVEKVKQDLARHDVDVEDFGGDTQVVCVSGKTGQGMDELEEAAVTLSEILDMRAEIDGQVEGWLLEATTKKAGRVATVLVRRGTLHQGDVIVAGSTWARVRTIKNEAGIEVASAGPGTPVEVDGWKEQPSAGDEVLQAPDEQKAKSVNAFRLERAERLKMAADMEAVNEARRMEQEKRDREEQIAAGAEVEAVEQKTGIKELFLIVKADVSGSVEAVVNSISALGNEEVRPHILRSGVGAVSEFDVEHAAVAKGQVVSFNMPIEPHATRLAEASGVPLVDQNIIYRLVDDVKAKLSDMLSPSVTKRVLGEADIAQVFNVTIKSRLTKPVAGCKVRNGVVSSNSKVRVLRDKDVIYDGMCSVLILERFLRFLTIQYRYSSFTKERQEGCT